MSDILKCPYCLKPATIIMGSDLHPHLPKLFSLAYYFCRACDAHIQTGKRGTMANRFLRKVRTEAHKTLDPLWSNGYMTRNTVYRWLSKQMHLEPEDCHIALMDVEQCLKVKDLCKNHMFKLIQREDKRKEYEKACT